MERTILIKFRQKTFLTIRFALQISYFLFTLNKNINNFYKYLKVEGLNSLFNEAYKHILIQNYKNMLLIYLIKFYDSMGAHQAKSC